MARPKKCRRICSEPDYDSFTPDGISAAEIINLTLDEYEAIRLIDYEKYTQEQCAGMMGIARTSVTDIYERARFKIADCIVSGKRLTISGGSYVLCDGSTVGDCKKPCRRKMQSISGHDRVYFEEKGANEMSVAVTYDNGQIFQHFGHTEQFKVYDIADGKVTSSQVVDTNGQGHGALAGFLFNGQVDVLICGGIGGGAQMALAQAGIKLYGGVSGDADAAVEAFLAGKLNYNPDVHCNHHDQEHGEGGHTCGSHGCGNHCGN